MTSRSNRAFVRTLATAGIWLLVTAVAARAGQGGALGAVAGSVATRGTRQPVSGAIVSLEGTSLTATVGATGRFRIDNVPPGSVMLVVRAPGFLDAHEGAIQVKAGDTAQVDIELDVTPNFMERVQVTATKTPLSIGDVPAQADIVSRETIENRGDLTLTQAISHVPGAVVSTQLGIFESVMLRGMPRGDPEFTNTLLLIDGVPQATSRNGSRVIGLTINDATNIEIVRGPNSALYGRTAIGGSVNVLTAGPTAKPEFNVDFTGGQQGTAKGLARVSGPVSNWGGFYASIGKERNTGYFDTKTGGDYSDGNTAVFGKLTFSPNRKSFGSVSFNYVDSDNSTPTNEPIMEGQLLHIFDPRFNRLTNFNIPGPNYHQGESRFTFNYNWQVAPSARLVEVFGYRDVDQQFIHDGDFIGSPFDPVANTVMMYPFDQQLKEKIAYEELRGEMMPRIGNIKNSLVVGWSYEHTGGTLSSDFLFTDEENEGIPINYLNPVIPPESEWQHDPQPLRTYHLGVTGVFAQYMIEPHPRWVLTGGGRYDRMALDNQRGADPVAEDTFSAFSPKASATYRLLGPESADRPSVNVYGAYSQAFLPPRAPSSLTPANVVIKLQPEDIANSEVGLKGNVARGRVSFEATYFHMVEDGVVLTQRQGPFFFPTNAGQLLYDGVETGLAVDVTPKVSAYVNASFYHSRFGDFVIQSEDGDEVLTGNSLPIAPDYVINWGASFRPTPSVDATVNIKSTSAVEANRENTFKIDPYTLVDAAVTWRHGPLRATLAARNLFNEEYYWNADGETADPGRPRQILFTLSVGIR
jgi:iron complex outermembrane recepter protein